VKLNRRQWLKRIFGASAGIGAGLAAGHALMGGDRPVYPIRKGLAKRPELLRLIRPPGAVPEPAFLAGCIRCTKCQDACDQGAIFLLPESAGRHLHTPVVDPAVKACNLCMKCTQVCPTGVLKPMQPEQRNLVAMGSVALDQSLCLSYKAKQLRDQQALLMDLGREPTEVDALAERRGPCGECHMFCPVRGQAITLEPGAFLSPIIHPDKCVGCGLCEEICRAVLRGEPAIRVVAKRSWT
jgi:ferredoxin-type protein NapG